MSLLSCSRPGGASLARGTLLRLRCAHSPRHFTKLWYAAKARDAATTVRAYMHAVNSVDVTQVDLSMDEAAFQTLEAERERLSGKLRLLTPVDDAVTFEATTAQLHRLTAQCQAAKAKLIGSLSQRVMALAKQVREESSQTFAHKRALCGGEIRRRLRRARRDGLRRGVWGPGPAAWPENASVVEVGGTTGQTRLLASLHGAFGAVARSLSRAGSEPAPAPQPQPPFPVGCVVAEIDATTICFEPANHQRQLTCATHSCQAPCCIVPHEAMYPRGDSR